MMTTKERITEEALTLFSEKGYKGTGVRDIAAAVGIKDASLYKHFKSKEEIFNAIVDRISNHIGNLSQRLGMPSDDADWGEAAIFYEKLDLKALTDLSRKAFLFYHTDPYISRFWKLAHMEQYRHPAIYEMFHRIFMEEAIAYQTRLFEEMMNRGVFRRDDPQAAAFHFYAPIFLLLNMYAEKKEQTEEALALLDRQIAAFYRLYRADKEEQ